MQLITAYITVILIWSTTPLAIQWSSESVGYLFGICSRFLIGAFFAVGLMIVLGKKLPMSGKAIQTYLSSGLGITFAMLSVYWAAQYIPSGWVSLIFGITPIITGLFAMKLLGERGLNVFRLIAIALSLLGLYIMMDAGIQYNSKTHLGVIGVLVSALFYSLSMVLVKRINADIDTYATVAGTMLVACSMLTLVWIFFGTTVPTDIPLRAGLSIFYLALVGSVLGFLLFYYVLKRVEAMRVSLITLVTPIFALLIGNLINNEPLSWNIIFSSFLILSGLLFFEFEGAIRRIIFIKIED